MTFSMDDIETAIAIALAEHHTATRRERIATAVLPSVMAAYGIANDDPRPHVCETAVAWADALITALQTGSAPTSEPLAYAIVCANGRVHEPPPGQGRPSLYTVDPGEGECAAHDEFFAPCRPHRVVWIGVVKRG